MGFSRQEYWSRLPFPTPGDLPDPGIEPTFPVSPAPAGRFFTIAPPGKPHDEKYPGTNRIHRKHRPWEISTVTCSSQNLAMPSSSVLSEALVLCAVSKCLFLPVYICPVLQYSLHSNHLSSDQISQICSNPLSKQSGRQ